MSLASFLPEKSYNKPTPRPVFKPACGNTHYANRGSLTLYGWSK